MIADKAKHLAAIDAVINRGPYAGDWASLAGGGFPVCLKIRLG